ncbi:unnamed protein product [Owenia fusiformis]|uniref:Uncharacterized protein n=1 Tax=Owenia fusiformis TaxID=6347 RepID=A0A8J1XEY6_OWEFU|nr:unnamed protein product [Owenia fusiformis]
MVYTEIHFPDCNPKPEAYYTALPKECRHRSYNLGRCREDIRLTEGEQEYCCGPTKQISFTLRCEGFRLKLVETFRCGWKVCNQFNNPTTGGVSIQDNSVTFYGRAFDVEDSSTPLMFGSVTVGGIHTTYTSFTGNFQFAVPQGQSRIVVNVKVRFIPQNLVETTKVFHIPAGHIGIFYKDIPMMHKPEPVIIDTSNTNRINLAPENDEPLAEILISNKDSLFTFNGQPYRGKLNAFVNFVDTRSLSSLDTMVGDLTFEDKEGNTGLLQTFGMFRLSFEDFEGREVKMEGTIDAAIKAEFVERSSGGERANLYSFNEKTGRWEGASRMSRGRRTKRAQANFDSTFLVGNIVITDRYWINFDNPNLNYCFINMRTYTDATFTTEIPWASSTEFTVIALDPTATSPWNQITTGGMSLNQQLASSQNCILTVCGTTDIHAYLFAENQNGPFSSSALLGGSAPVYPVNNIIPTISGAAGSIIHNKPIDTTATLGAPGANTEGPVYHNAFNNPALAQTQCRSATTANPHYRFYRDPNSLYEYSVCLNFFACPMMPAIYPLIWFPQAPTTYWAWYVKVRVSVVGQPLTESSVRATSKGALHPLTLNQIFGIREDTTTSRTVCLEYKGSGNIIVSITPPLNPPDETKIDIDVQGTGCVGTPSAGLVTYQQPSGSLFSFKPPSGVAHGGTGTGLYFANAAAMNSAKSLAKARCECADITLGTPNCQVPLPAMGVGLSVTCQP